MAPPSLPPSPFLHTPHRRTNAHNLSLAGNSSSLWTTQKQAYSLNHTTTSTSTQEATQEQQQRCCMAPLTWNAGQDSKGLCTAMLPLQGQHASNCVKSDEDHRGAAAARSCCCALLQASTASVDSEHTGSRALTTQKNAAATTTWACRGVPGK